MLIGYARVSTTDQNLDRQTEALTAAGCERIYADRISSRKDWQTRPEWSRMWDALRPGDVLVVLELDRMGRDLRDLLRIVRDLDTRGVRLRIVQGMFSGVLLGAADGTPEQRLSQDLLLTTAAAFAEYERAVNRTRTLEGLAEARRKGRAGGRPPKLSPLEVQLLLSLYHDPSVSTVSIARQFGIKPDTVRAYAARSEGFQTENTRNPQTSVRGDAITDAAVIPRNENLGSQPQKAPPSKRLEPSRGR